MGDIAKASKKQKKIVAVAVSVNSPGGSAAQSSIAGGRLKAFAKRIGVPYFTFAETLAASGGYWILCTGKECVAMV